MYFKLQTQQIYILLFVQQLSDLFILVYFINI